VDLNGRADHANRLPTIPPRVDYELTDLGAQGCGSRRKRWAKWCERHQTEIEDARARFDRRNEAADRVAG